MARYWLRLIGPMQLTDPAGRLLRVPPGKLQGLLAYLAYQPGHRVARGEIAELLWSERPPGRARHSLSQALTMLRKAAGPLIAESPDAGTLSLDAERVSVDVDAVRADSRVGTVESLAEAAELVHGELLEGVEVDEPDFDAWLVSARSEVRDLSLGIYWRLLETAQQTEDQDAVVRWGHRLLQLDPTFEPAHRALIEAHATRGALAIARAQFDECRRHLREDLGLEPEPETLELVERLRLYGRPAPAPAPRRRAEGAHGAEGRRLPRLLVLPARKAEHMHPQASVADSITHDLCTQLGRYRSFEVFGWRTAFAQRGRHEGPDTIAWELGADYALDSNLTLAGGTARLAVELLAAPEGKPLWTERYDFDLPDLFDVQNDVMASIVGHVPILIERDRLLRARRKPTECWDAFDHMLRGAEIYAWSWNSTEKVAEALPHFEKAVELDPNFAQAYAWSGCFRGMLANWFTNQPDRSTSAYFDHPRRALELDPEEAAAHRILAAAHVTEGQLDPAHYHLLQGLRLTPHNPDLHAHLGRYLTHYGKPERALQALSKARHLNPLHPDWYWEQIGVAYHALGRPADAVEALEKVRAPCFYEHMYMAACRSEMEQLRRADEHLIQLRADRPDLTVSRIEPHLPYRRAEAKRRLLSALARLGLPQEPHYRSYSRVDDVISV